MVRVQSEHTINSDQLNLIWFNFPFFCDTPHALSEFHSKKLYDRLQLTWLRKQPFTSHRAIHLSTLPLNDSRVRQQVSFNIERKMCNAHAEEKFFFNCVRL